MTILLGRRLFSTLSELANKCILIDVVPSELTAVQFSSKGKVALLTLHRPDALNALNSHLTGELEKCLEHIDANDELSTVVLTGSEKSFAGIILQKTVRLSF